VLGGDFVTPFEIRRVNVRLREHVETLGTKPKFWFREDDRLLLTNQKRLLQSGDAL
jgi:hypothetical protein